MQCSTVTGVELAARGNAGLAITLVAFEQALHPDGQTQLAHVSEELLGVFEQLSAICKGGMQVRVDQELEVRSWKSGAES